MDWQATIFDLDGVVVDTVPLHFKAWKRMADEYGRAFNFEDYKAKVDGIPRMSGARAILAGMDEAVIQEAAQKKQVFFLEYLEQEEVPRHDSTLRFIDELFSHQIKVAVISASRNAPLVLKRIGLYDRIHAVVCGNDVKKGKPDPEMFLTAAARLQVEPKASVVFEDAVLGVKAAKRAHMFCVGIDRYDDPKRLQEADLVIQDAKEISVKKLKEILKTA